MSRGPGKYQQIILRIVETLEPNQYIALAEIISPNDSRSIKESFRRAVRTLTAKGLIQSGKFWIPVTKGGETRSQLGTIIAPVGGMELPKPGMSDRERGRMLEMSHSTIGRMRKELERAGEITSRLPGDS